MKMSEYVNLPIIEVDEGVFEDSDGNDYPDYIAHAINKHDDLVDALKLAVKAMSMDVCKTGGNLRLEPVITKLHEIISGENTG